MVRVVGKEGALGAGVGGTCSSGMDAYITADANHASTRNIKKRNWESVYDVPGPYLSVHTSHYSRLEKPTIYRLPPKKDYHVQVHNTRTWYLSLRIRPTDASQLEKRNKENKSRGKEGKYKEAKLRRRKGNKRKDKKSRKGPSATAINSKVLEG